MFTTTDFVNTDIAAEPCEPRIKPKSNKVSKRRSSVKIVNLYDTL